jgi:hypothetical protein
MEKETKAANSELTSMPYRNSGTSVVRRASVPRTLAGNEPIKHNAAEIVEDTLIEIDSAELEDETQIEIIEDPEDSSRTLLAVFKDGEVRLVDRFKYGNRTFVPIPRSSNLIHHIRLPRGVERYESVQSLLNQAMSILYPCLDLEENDLRLLAQFAISTWFIERLPVAPYIALVGLPRSGKSTALTVLSLLCRRSLLTADISSAAFYRVCDRLMPTLLIDETSTAGQRRILFHLLRTGTSRDLVALRKDQSFKIFGPKVVSWIELPNDAALNSRCVVISLHETRRTDLLRSTNPVIRRAADEFQKQLLRFRFEKAKDLALPKIEGDHQLRSRSLDLYHSLALPAAEDAKICQWLIEYLKNHEDSNRVPLSPDQNSVLRTLFKHAHEYADGQTQIKHLAAEVNADLRESGERFQVNPREVGGALKILGFTKRKRLNSGWAVRMSVHEVKKVHDLIAAYGVERCTDLISKAARRACSFCNDSGISKD